MCSIITVKSGLVDLNDLVGYVEEACHDNPHGFSLIIADNDTGLSQLRTFNMELILNTIFEGDWDRLWFHARYATKGSIELKNTHGWLSQGGIAVLHNGVLKDPDTLEHEVDSQLILDWLDTLTTKELMIRLKRESFANVFLVNTLLGSYSVSRSLVGTLFTDNLGNFSTNQIGNITIPVTPGFQRYYTSESLKCRTS